MNKLKTTQKEYQILSLLLINNWKEINFPSHKKDWNEFGKNSKTIAYAIAYAMQ